MRTLSCRSAGQRSKLATLPVAVALALASSPGHGVVDLPTAPLQSAAAIPSNILFLLDDSGSMLWPPRICMPQRVTSCSVSDAKSLPMLTSRAHGTPRDASSAAR